MIAKQLKNPTKIARLTLMVALLALCLYLGASIVGLLTQHSEDPKPLATVRAAETVYWNWFRGDRPVVIVEQTHGELAEANINAQLLGILIAGEDSLATLKFNGKPEAVYHRGDQLDSVTVIIDIEPYRLVVKQNGVNKQVLMKKPDSLMTSEPGSADLQQQQGFSMANMFAAVPVMAAGGRGLKMNKLSDELKQLADFQEGDVVTQVDGVAIQALMANPAQWMKYSTSSNLPVTVIRQGQAETIYINAASLSANMLPKLGLIQ